MKHEKKFGEQAEERQSVAGQQSESTAAREFGSVEELIRHDALHTPVPPRISERLRESIGRLPPPPQPWWRRFFGG